MASEPVPILHFNSSDNNGFLNKTLDKSLWIHKAHIIVGIWHLMKYGKEDTLSRLRCGIIYYNLAADDENTGENGYHETITIFWWEVITQFLDGHSGYLYASNCRDFLHAPWRIRIFPSGFIQRKICCLHKPGQDW